jgi:hypothetical protein
MDTHDANHGNENGRKAGRWVFAGFALIALYFLFTEHRAHLFAALPYLLLAACPLMHVFHHGHHRHRHYDNKDEHGRDLDSNAGSASDPRDQ